MRQAKATLSDLQIPVTVSEMAYGYQERGGAQDVLDAIDLINVHMLPFFSQNATTGAAAWPLVQDDTNWFIQHGGGKKIYFDEVCGDLVLELKNIDSCALRIEIDPYSD